MQKSILNEDNCSVNKVFTTESKVLMNTIHEYVNRSKLPEFIFMKKYKTVKIVGSGSSLSVFFLSADTCTGINCYSPKSELMSFSLSYGILTNLAVMAVTGVVFFCLILVVENPSVRNRTRLRVLRSQQQVNVEF